MLRVGNVRSLHISYYVFVLYCLASCESSRSFLMNACVLTCGRSVQFFRKVNKLYLINLQIQHSAERISIEHPRDGHRVILKIFFPMKLKWSCRLVAPSLYACSKLLAVYCVHIWPSNPGFPTFTKLTCVPYCRSRISCHFPLGFPPSPPVCIWS